MKADFARAMRRGYESRPAKGECPLWVISGHSWLQSRGPLSANSGHPRSADLAQDFSAFMNEALTT